MYAFQLASDIHIEKVFPKFCEITDYILPSSPCLVLAGDIGSIYHYDHFKFFMLSCRKHFSMVIYVPGNNEYYTREGFDTKTKAELDNDLQKLCLESDVILLNNAYIETDDLIVFGSIWWSYIPDELNIRIFLEKDKPMTSDDFNFLHAESRRMLNWILDYKEKTKKRLLVITHYCPTRLGTMNGHHKKDDFIELIPYYFSASEKYLKRNLINTWVFGHTHVFRDFFFNHTETRIISNADPRKKYFRLNYVFEV